MVGRTSLAAFAATAMLFSGAGLAYASDELPAADTSLIEVYVDSESQILGQTDTPGTVGAVVPATLALTLGAPAMFPPFTPGVANTYTASTTANVISTAGDATLTVTDPSPTNTGHLVNGAFVLPQPLQGLGVVKTWTGPTSNESVPITFRQAIGANDALRTDTYSKTLTFTLSTTNP